MLLRSIIEHVKAQNWTAVVLDFVIVVVGILIAFQITEWNAARADRDREAEILEDMLADLEIDRTEYAAGIDYALRRIGGANASLAGAGRPIVSEFPYAGPYVGESGIITAPKTPTIPAERRDYLWGEIFIGFWPTPSTLAFDAMVGAGDIDIIQDRDLVRQMQAYKNRIVRTEHVTENVYLPLRNAALETGSEYGLAPLAAVRADDLYRLVKEEPQLEALIRMQVQYSIFHYENLKQADAQAAALQERLRAAGAHP